MYFPASRFMSPRIVRKLHMANDSDVLSNSVGKIALHNLHVVDVVLILHDRMIHVLNQLGNFHGSFQVKSGHITCIQCLNEEPNVFPRQGVSGKPQVFTKFCKVKFKNE